MIDYKTVEHKHEFLAEELMAPNASKCDGVRSNMFAANLVQTVVLEEAEIPKVFTRFENQVGEISSAYKKINRKCRVKDVIYRNKNNFVIIIQYLDNKEIDIITVENAVNITENYGYRVDIEDAKKIKVNDILEKDKLIYKSTFYDEHLNLQYGRNLKTLYYAYEGLTYEDGLVISESASKKLTHNAVSKALISINTNDILVNLYGNNEVYKSFPDIGEDIQNGIICSRRRINYDFLLNNLTTNKLQDIATTDTIFYNKTGKIVDIKIFSNATIETLKKNPFNVQFVKYLEQETNYNKSLVHSIEHYMNSHALSNDIAYAYKRAKDALDPAKKWDLEGSSFDNVIIEFKILESKTANIGSKITNRYGGKGVISMILPDHEMPTTEDGETAEVILNPLSIVNRLNPAALYELELNFIANEILKRIKDNNTLENVENNLDIIIAFYNEFNESQALYFSEKIENMNMNERIKILNEFLEFGLIIHQPPFFDNITWDDFSNLYKKYDVHPVKFKGIEEPLIMGDMYLIKLKHEPFSKFSARSAKQLSIKGLPSKSKDFKEYRSPYSTTPIKLGEQELINLLLGNGGKDVISFLNSHSSNKTDREEIIKKILTSKNIYEIESFEDSDENQLSEILQAYLRNIGLELID